MLAFDSTRLVKISTPYMKRGVLYDDFQRAFGQNDPDLLVWRAPTTLMNLGIRTERLERERRLDASRFAREYEAEFGEDLEGFLPPAWVDGAIRVGRHELAYRDGVRYRAAVDPSGGGPDTFAVAVVHAEGVSSDARIVVDVMKGWSQRGVASVDLAGVVREISAILKRYRVRRVGGDKYASKWVSQAFAETGVAYVASPADASTAMHELEPFFAEGRVDLLDHPQLAQELKALERRLRAGGKTRIEHPRGGHDDHAVALALATLQCAPDTKPQVSIDRMLAGGRQRPSVDNGDRYCHQWVPEF